MGQTFTSDIRCEFGAKSYTECNTPKQLQFEAQESAKRFHFLLSRSSYDGRWGRRSIGGVLMRPLCVFYLFRCVSVSRFCGDGMMSGMMSSHTRGAAIRWTVVA